MISVNVDAIIACGRLLACGVDTSGILDLEGPVETPTKAIAERTRANNAQEKTDLAIFLGWDIVLLFYIMWICSRGYPFELSLHGTHDKDLFIAQKTMSFNDFLHSAQSAFLRDLTRRSVLPPDIIALAARSRS